MEKVNSSYATASNNVAPPYLSSSEEPRGYALSGKIMLSAIVILFSVVVIMVCLHVYARWYILRARRRQVRRARRRTHLVFYIDPNSGGSSSIIPSRGLDPALLASLPTFTFKSIDNNNKVVNDKDHHEIDIHHHDNEDDRMECSVCLSEFEEGEMGRLLPKCGHSFHVECIDMWFHSHSTCPICRSPVEPPPPPPPQFESGLSQLSGVPESSQVGDDELVGPSSRRKGGMGLVGVTIEVPRRSQSFSFSPNSDESGPSQAFKSPTSRILSLRRILSRERKSPLPSPNGSSCRVENELDVELGRVEDASLVHPSQSLTPR